MLMQRPISQSNSRLKVGYLASGKVGFRPLRFPAGGHGHRHAILEVESIHRGHAGNLLQAGGGVGLDGDGP